MKDKQNYLSNDFDECPPFSFTHIYHHLHSTSQKIHAAVKFLPYVTALLLQGQSVTILDILG